MDQATVRSSQNGTSTSSPEVTPIKHTPSVNVMASSSSSPQPAGRASSKPLSDALVVDALRRDSASQDVPLKSATGKRGGAAASSSGAVAGNDSTTTGASPAAAAAASSPCSSPTGPSLLDRILGGGGSSGSNNSGAVRKSTTEAAAVSNTSASPSAAEQTPPLSHANVATHYNSSTASSSGVGGGETTMKPLYRPPHTRKTVDDVPAASRSTAASPPEPTSTSTQRAAGVSDKSGANHTVDSESPAVKATRSPAVLSHAKPSPSLAPSSSSPAAALPPSLVSGKAPNTPVSMAEHVKALNPRPTQPTSAMSTSTSVEPTAAASASPPPPSPTPPSYSYSEAARRGVGAAATTTTTTSPTTSPAVGPSPTSAPPAEAEVRAPHGSEREHERVSIHTGRDPTASDASPPLPPPQSSSSSSPRVVALTTHEPAAKTAEAGPAETPVDTAPPPLSKKARAKRNKKERAAAAAAAAAALAEAPTTEATEPDPSWEPLTQKPPLLPHIASDGSAAMDGPLSNSRANSAGSRRLSAATNAWSPPGAGSSGAVLPLRPHHHHHHQTFNASVPFSYSPSTPPPPSMIPNGHPQQPQQQLGSPSHNNAAMSDWPLGKSSKSGQRNTSQVVDESIVQGVAGPSERRGVAGRSQSQGGRRNAGGAGGFMNVGQPHHHHHHQQQQQPQQSSPVYQVPQCGSHNTPGNVSGSLPSDGALHVPSSGSLPNGASAAFPSSPATSLQGQPGYGQNGTAARPSGGGGGGDRGAFPSHQYQQQQQPTMMHPTHSPASPSTAATATPQQQAWTVSMMPPLDLIASLPVFIEACLMLTPEEKAMREAFFQNMRAITRASFSADSSVEVRVHGSVTTGLALTSSDIDLLVVQYQPMLPLDALYTVADALLQVDVMTLAEAKARVALIDEEAADVAGLFMMQAAAEAAASSTTREPSNASAVGVSPESKPAHNDPFAGAGSAAPPRAPLSRSHTALIWPSSTEDAGADAVEVAGVGADDDDDDAVVIAAIETAEKAEAEAVALGHEMRSNGRPSQLNTARMAREESVDGNASGDTLSERIAVTRGDVPEASDAAIGVAAAAPTTTVMATTTTTPNHHNSNNASLSSVATKSASAKLVYGLTGTSDTGADVNEVYHTTDELEQAELEFRDQIERDYTFTTKSTTVGALEAAGVAPTATAARSLAALETATLGASGSIASARRLPLSSPMSLHPATCEEPVLGTTLPAVAHEPAAAAADDEDAASHNTKPAATATDATDASAPSPPSPTTTTTTTSAAASQPLFKRRTAQPTGAAADGDDSAAVATAEKDASTAGGPVTFHTSNVTVQEGPLYYVQTIISTRVPVIKVTDKMTGMKADITFAGGEHWRSMQLTRQLVTLFPQARPLILFLKYLVCHTGIGESEPGGVSSFVIYLMVRHFFNECVKRVVNMLRQREEAMKVFFATHVPAPVLRAFEEEAADGGNEWSTKGTSSSSAAAAAPATTTTTATTPTTAIATPTTMREPGYPPRAAVPTMAVLEHLLNTYFHAVDDSRREAAASWITHTHSGGGAGEGAEPVRDSQPDAWRNVRDVVLSFLDPPPLPPQQDPQTNAASVSAPPPPRTPTAASHTPPPVQLTRSAPTKPLQCDSCSPALSSTEDVAGASQDETRGRSGSHLLAAVTVPPLPMKTTTTSPKAAPASTGVANVTGGERGERLRQGSDPAVDADADADPAAVSGDDAGAGAGARAEDSPPHDAALEAWAIEYLRNDHTTVAQLFYDFCHYFGCAFNYETTGIHFDVDGNSHVVVKPYMCARRGQHFHMTSPFDPEYDLTARMTNMRAFQELCWWFAMYATPPPMMNSAMPPPHAGCTLQYVLQWLNPMGMAQDLYSVHERLIDDYQQQQQQQQQSQAVEAAAQREQYGSTGTSGEHYVSYNNATQMGPQTTSTRSPQPQPTRQFTPAAESREPQEDPCKPTAGAGSQEGFGPRQTRQPQNPQQQQSLLAPPRKTNCSSASTLSGVSSVRSQSAGSLIEKKPKQQQALNARGTPRTNITHFQKQRPDSPSTNAEAAAAATASMTALALPDVDAYPEPDLASQYAAQGPYAATDPSEQALTDGELARGEAPVEETEVTAMASASPVMLEKQQQQPLYAPSDPNAYGAQMWSSQVSATNAQAVYYQQQQQQQQQQMYSAAAAAAAAGVGVASMPMMMNPADPSMVMSGGGGGGAAGVVSPMPVLSQEMNQYLYYYHLQQQQQQYYSNAYVQMAGPAMGMGVYMYPAPMMMMPQPSQQQHQQQQQQHQQQQQQMAMMGGVGPSQNRNGNVGTQTRHSRRTTSTGAPAAARSPPPASVLGPHPTTTTSAPMGEQPSTAKPSNIAYDHGTGGNVEEDAERVPKKKPTKPPHGQTLRADETDTTAAATPTVTTVTRLHCDAEEAEPSAAAAQLLMTSPDDLDVPVSHTSTPIVPSTRQGQRDWMQGVRTQPAVQLTAATIRATPPVHFDAEEEAGDDHHHHHEDSDDIQCDEDGDEADGQGVRM